MGATGINGSDWLSEWFGCAAKAMVETSILAYGGAGRAQTEDELSRAYDAARAKLSRIIELEGDADGARLTPEYLQQLINEQLVAGREALCTLSEYKKKRNAAYADTP